jgi:hypothetical protein
MKLLKLKLLVFALIMFAAGSAFATYSYEVTVNTSSLTGSGILDFQYDSFGGASSTATVSNFSTNGTLALLNDTLDAQNPSAVSGVLPGQVTFTNPNSVNEYIHAITFGSSLSFLVTLSSPASGGQSTGSSAFSLGLFSDTINWNPLLNTTDPNYAGTVFTIDLNNNGSTSANVLGGSPAVVSPTPIPPTALLFGASLFGLIGIRRRAKN